MSTSLRWCIVDPDPRKFARGSPKDYVTLGDIFGNKISTNDRGMLRAMHAASGLNFSLWSEIYETLTNLQEGDPHAVIEIEVWIEH